MNKHISHQQLLPELPLLWSEPTVAASVKESPKREEKIISSNFDLDADSQGSITTRYTMEVTGVIMWCNRATNTVVEFDVELYVNGVRYV